MNLGGIYQGLGNLDQALASFLQSLELKPDNPNAHMNMGMLYFLSGDYKNGWEKYEYRLEAEDSSLYVKPNCKKLTKENYNQLTTLLVVGEQGIGDIIQFSRYIKTLRAEGVVIRFCLETKLHSLVKASAIDPIPLDKVEATKITDGHWVPLLSIPEILEVTPEKPIITEPYIKASDDLIRDWKIAFSELRKPVIGINWKSNRKDIINNSRDIPVEYFAKLSKSFSGTFISLQKDSQSS